MDSKRGYLLDSFDRGFSMAAKSQLVHFLEPYFGQARSTKSGRASTGTATTSTRVILVEIDGGGTTIATGVVGDFTIPFAATITGWTLLADRSGSIVVNVWKDTYANYPPTVADKITASAPPTITTATNNRSTTLTGWTTAITAGDTLRFNIDSITSIRRVTLGLTITA